MGVRTTITCDRCNADLSATGSAYLLAFQYAKLYEGGERVQSLQYTPSHLSAIWCYECMIRAGIARVRGALAEKIEVKPVTLDELIRGIVREEIDGSAS